MGGSRAGRLLDTCGTRWMGDAGQTRHGLERETRPSSATNATKVLAVVVLGLIGLPVVRWL